MGQRNCQSAGQWHWLAVVTTNGPFQHRGHQIGLEKNRVSTMLRMFQNCALMKLLLLALTVIFICPLADDRVSLVDKDFTTWRSPWAEWRMVGIAEPDPRGHPSLFCLPGRGMVVNGFYGRTLDLVSEAEFGEVAVHVTFKIPEKSESGIYFMGRYEIQIADSSQVEKPKYPGLECGGIMPSRFESGRGINGHSPRLNACTETGTWQTFDITFRPPRFDMAGKKIANAEFVEVLHNGKVIHEHVEVPEPTLDAMWNDEKPGGPIVLQGSHGQVAFRTVTVKRLDAKADSAQLHSDPGLPRPTLKSNLPSKVLEAAAPTLRRFGIEGELLAGRTGMSRVLQAIVQHRCDAAPLVPMVFELLDPPYAFPDPRVSVHTVFSMVRCPQVLLHLIQEAESNDKGRRLLALHILSAWGEDAASASESVWARARTGDLTAAVAMIRIGATPNAALVKVLRSIESDERRDGLERVIAHLTAFLCGPESVANVSDIGFFTWSPSRDLRSEQINPTLVETVGALRSGSARPEQLSRHLGKLARDKDGERRLFAAYAFWRLEQDNGARALRIVEQFLLQQERLGKKGAARQDEWEVVGINYPKPVTTRLDFYRARYLGSPVYAAKHPSSWCVAMYLCGQRPKESSRWLKMIQEDSGRLGTREGLFRAWAIARITGDLKAYVDAALNLLDEEVYVPPGSGPIE
jgi:hypothetical protein